MVYIARAPVSKVPLPPPLQLQSHMIEMVNADWIILHNSVIKAPVHDYIPVVRDSD